MEKIYKATCLKDNTAWRSEGLSFTVKNPAEFFKAIYSDFRQRDRSESSRFLERVSWRLLVNEKDYCHMTYTRHYNGDHYKSKIRVYFPDSYRAYVIRSSAIIPCMEEPIFDIDIKEDF